MFISQEHHPQVLGRDCYHNREQFDKEIARLFLPAWHCVGLMSELPRDGSYLLRELFGRSVIIWRKNDRLHAFLNVCSHRYSELTAKPCGHAERLKCQYHGWQYDTDGSICHIPDAKTFRPLKPGMLGLTPYHAERCGQLIFVSLDDNPPSLREFLDGAFEKYEELF